MSTTPEKKRKGGEEPPVQFKDYPGPDDRQIALTGEGAPPPVEKTKSDKDADAQRAKAERQKKR